MENQAWLVKRWQMITVFSAGSFICKELKTKHWSYALHLSWPYSPDDIMYGQCLVFHIWLYTHPDENQALKLWKTKYWPYIISILENADTSWKDRFSLDISKHALMVNYFFYPWEWNNQTKRNKGFDYKYLPSKQESAGQEWSMVACVADSSGPLWVFY